MYMSPTPTSLSRFARLAGLLFLLVVAAGCSSKKYAEKTDEVVQPPEDEGVDLEGLGTESWCSDFGQSGLDRMVQRTWSKNMRLKAAWARLRQAEAVADIAGSELFPSVEASAGGNYSSRQFEGSSGAGRAGESFWDLSAAASYEIDVWGRHRNRKKAADIEAEAVESDARALAITLTSQVAEAWFDVVAQRERVALLEEQLDISRDLLEITRQRLRRGLVGPLDVAQQERNVESIRGDVSTARGLLATAQNRLAVLVGQPPAAQDFVGAETLPDVEPIAGAGVPANLLERRPDVLGAYLNLQAADKRTAAAVADRLPRLEVSASIGFQATQLANLFKQLFLSVGAGITQTLFEGGRLNAEIERNEAVAQEHLYQYAQTLLVAIREVQDALALERNQQDRIESLRRERGKAQQVVDIARKRYQTGAVDYLRVLTGLQELQQVERNLLEARRQQISHRIALCRALGGSWVDSVEPSITSDD